MSDIYFDYNATTPLDEEVFQSMIPYMKGYYGNPSSVHRVGRKAKAELDDFRYDVSELWKCKPSEVVFTSGGTES
ncbi:MAG: aminotransferase class V-fold PLP-dependent enzyme, partial [Verrucomicrobia bacterium]|nr:aminotransferase class V-fold PLP-dependent enzyme [Verrucomicrobiota bacterium]